VPNKCWLSLHTKGQSTCNLAKGDIVSYLPGGSTRRVVCHGRCIGPPFWGRGSRRESAKVPFERAVVVSYKLSIVTIALYLTI